MAEFMTPGKRVLTAMRRAEPDRGLLIAPTHLVEPEVPWENIMALVEAVEELGYYR